MDRKKKTLLFPLLDRTLEALKGQRSMRTLENYHSSINKVKEFVGDGWEHLTVEDITRGWTDRFTTWLESRHADKPQTVDFYLRTFRALYSHSLALSDNERDIFCFREFGKYAAVCFCFPKVAMQGIRFFGSIRTGCPFPFFYVRADAASGRTCRLRQHPPYGC